MCIVIIHNAGYPRPVPRGPVVGDLRLCRSLGVWDTDSYVMQRALGYRVYLVGIGNSIRVRDYSGGEGKKVREKGGQKREKEKKGRRGERGERSRSCLSRRREDRAGW